MQNDQLMELVGARARRRFSRGLKVLVDILRPFFLADNLLLEETAGLDQEIKKGEERSTRARKACLCEDTFEKYDRSS